MGRAQLTYRWVGRVLSSTDSNTATGISGQNCHQLPGKGSFLLVANGTVDRFQSYFMQDHDDTYYHKVRSRWNMVQAEKLTFQSQQEQMALWENATVVES